MNESHLSGYFSKFTMSASYKDRVLGTLCDGEQNESVCLSKSPTRLNISGEIEFVLYKDEYYESLREAIYTGYFQNESVCLGAMLNEPEAELSRTELMWFVRETLKDGLSVMARDAKTGKIVGHVINKLQVPNKPNELSFFDNFMQNICKGDEAREMMHFMMDLENEVNLYKLFKVETMLEIMILGVLPEYRRKSIGLKLVELSLQVAKDVKNGVALNLLPPDMRVFGKNLRIGTAIYASIYSKRIGDVLGFKVHHEYFYDQVKYKGKTYADRIPNKLQRSSTLVSVDI